MEWVNAGGGGEGGSVVEQEVCRSRRREKDGLMSKGEIGNKCGHQLLPNVLDYKQVQTRNQDFPVWEVTKNKVRTIRSLVLIRHWTHPLLLFPVGRTHERVQDNVVRLHLGGSYKKLRVREKVKCRSFDGD